MTSTHRRVTAAAAIVLPPLAMFLIHVRAFGSFFADDAFISLRYARRLIEGRGLTWTDGPPVEGYSNFLWTVSCAALGRIGIDLVTAARLLGVVCTLAVFAALIRRYGRAGVSPSYLFSAWLIALSGSMAAWAIGGLEQPMLAALLAWTLVQVFEAVDRPERGRPHALTAGILLGMIALTRPDGMVFAVVIVAVIGLALREEPSRGPIARRIAVPAVAAYLLHLAFRRAYYGEWVPNTALVKLAPTWVHLGFGWTEVWKGCVFLSPVILACLFFAMRARASMGSRDGAAISTAPSRGPRGPAERTNALVCAACASVWLLYGIASGGDTFPARRLFVPVVVLLAFGASELMKIARSRGPDRWSVAVGVAALVVFGIGQSRDYQNRRAVEETWEWTGKEVGLMLEQRFGSTSPLLALEPAGAVAYWSKLPGLDLFGLSDHYLPRHRPPSFGHGVPGHELGDRGYVLERAPDLVLFGGPRGGETFGSPSTDQLCNDPRFLARYANVEFLAPDTNSIITSLWVRRDSRKVDLDSLLAEGRRTRRVRVVDR